MVCGAICDRVSSYYTVIISNYARHPREPSRNARQARSMTSNAVKATARSAPVMDAENGEAGSCFGHANPYRSLVIVLDIGEALIARRRPFERAALLAGTPRDEIFDLARKFEVLVGNSFRAVVLQFDLDPRVGRGDIRMMPGGLREMADGVDHHQRAFPTRGAKGPPDPAVFVAPMRELALEPRLDFARLIGALFRILAHCVPPISSATTLGRPAKSGGATAPIARLSA